MHAQNVLSHGPFIALACLLLSGPAVDGVRAGPGIGEASHRESGLAVLHGHAVQVAYLHGSSVGPLTYVASVFGTIGIVVFLYWSRSVLEICSIVVYLFALSTVRLSVKAVFVEYKFDFPLAVSAVHFVICAIVAFSVLLYRQLYTKQPIPVPSKSEFVFTILPIAMSFAICIGVGNKVLVLCSVALTEILMATQPIVSIPMVLMLGMPFDIMLLLPTCLVVVSCVVCAYGDVHFSPLGLVLAVLSNVLRALKAALQQKMLTGAQRDRFDPCALLAWMSVPSASLMLGWSAVVEGRAPLNRLLTDPEQRPMIVVSVLVSGAAACILNLSQLFVVGGLGAVGSQIVAQLKTMLTILGGVALLSEKVTAVQCVGFAGVLVGIFFYSRMDLALKQAATRKRQHEAREACKAEPCSAEG